MDLYWDELPIHVIDFEGGPRCGIVEFGVVTMKGADVLDCSTRLCRPQAPITRAEKAIHGIKTEAADEGDPFQDEWERFARYREKGPLAAHFASAENTMIKSAFPFARKSPDWTRRGGIVNTWGPWIDTGQLYRDIGDADRSLKLEDLIDRYSLQGELDELAGRYCPMTRCGYHCALYDALASALLLALYCTQLSDERPTLRSLLIHSQGSARKRQQVEQQELF